MSGQVPDYAILIYQDGRVVFIRSELNCVVNLAGRMARFTFTASDNGIEVTDPGNIYGTQLLKFGEAISLPNGLTVTPVNRSWVNRNKKKILQEGNLALFE